MKTLITIIGLILFFNSSAQLNFTYQINGGNVTFSISSASYYESVKWNFGDGTSSSGYNLNSVSHTYTMNANYTVCVIGYPMPIATNDTTCKAINLVAVGFKENNLNEISVDVFPNPFNDRLFVHSYENKILEETISNNLGQVVYTINTPNQKHEIDLSFLVSGIYYLEVESDEGRNVFKILKTQD